LNLTEYKWIIAYWWKTEIKLFVNSHKWSYFLSQHHILLYLFTNILFKCHKKVKNLQNLAIEIINFSFNVEKFIKNQSLFVQSLNKYFWKKWIVYQDIKFGIWSLFISIRFKIDRIVQDWENITVTSPEAAKQICSIQTFDRKRMLEIGIEGLGPANFQTHSFQYNTRYWPGCAFSMLHFRCNLGTGPISYSVCHW
jgi:hypothetical protein